MTPALSKRAFWDTDIDQMDSQQHASFIILRVFQYGLLNDIREVMKVYTPLQIKQAFHGQRGIDPKAISLAALLIHADESELK